MNKGYIYKRRLLALATLLSKLKPRRFNYNTWVGASWRGKPDLSCGTTACAFGWATTMPSLRRLGLQLRRGEFGGSTEIILKKPSGIELDSYRAAREVFGLNEYEFSYLFVPGAYAADSTYLLDLGVNSRGPSFNAKAKTVAKHIRDFVKVKYNKGK